MRRLSVLFFIYVFLTACGDDRPEGIIPQEEMVPILVDLHLADGYAMSALTADNNSFVSGVYKTIYKKHNTDSVKLRKSLEYYSKHPEDLSVVYEQVDKRIADIQKVEEKRLALEREAQERKFKREEDIRKAKEEAIADRLKMKQGLYDFNLPDYKSPAEDFFKFWKYPAKTKTTATKTDSLKTDSLKKEQLKNDIPTKRDREARIY